MGRAIFEFSIYFLRYMIPMELQFCSICYFHIHFHLISKVEVNEMYEKNEEIFPQIAIFDHNAIGIKLSNQNGMKSITRILLSC